MKLLIVLRRELTIKYLRNNNKMSIAELKLFVIEWKPKKGRTKMSKK
jgi:hypothetical protein